MAVQQDDDVSLNFLKEFENLWLEERDPLEKLANTPLKQQEEIWVKLLHDSCIKLQAENHGVAVEPNLSISQRFTKLPP
jgi:hypothetical protein